MESIVGRGRDGLEDLLLYDQRPRIGGSSILKEFTRLHKLGRHELMRAYKALRFGCKRRTMRFDVPVSTFRGCSGVRISAIAWQDHRKIEAGCPRMEDIMDSFDCALQLLILRSIGKRVGALCPARHGYLCNQLTGNHPAM